MPPRLALIIAFVPLLLAPAVSAAQQAAPDDTTVRAPIPTVAAARVAASPASDTASAPARVTATRRERLPMIFYGALGTAAVTAAVLRVDPDSGGYRDGWTTATDFPDKAVHALAAWALTTVGIDLGARPRHSALAVCAAGTAFEVAQGYASPYDIAADCIGAGGAALWQTWRARRRARTPPAPPSTP
jgi:hypothetical protein